MWWNRIIENYKVAHQCDKGHYWDYYAKNSRRCEKCGYKEIVVRARTYDYMYCPYYYNAWREDTPAWRKDNPFVDHFITEEKKRDIAYYNI